MAQTLKHGQYLFIYNNIRTNQVIYSLTRALNACRFLHNMRMIMLKSDRIMLLSSNSPF
jgi:hypothetical protein